MSRLPRLSRLATALWLASAASLPLAAPVSITPQAADAFRFSPPRVAATSELKRVVDALNAGDRKGAKTQLAEIIKRNPDDARAVEIAGMILLEENNLQAAALSFRRAADLAPNSTSAKAKLGVTALLQNRLPEGESVLREVLAKNPNELLAHRYVAWIDETRGFAGDAAAHLEVILQHEDFDKSRLNDVHVALARNYVTLGRPAQAVRVLEPLAAKASGPGAIAASLVLAQAYADLHKPQAATQALEPARKALRGDDPNLLLALASIDLARHQYLPARDRLQRAIKGDASLERFARFRMAASYMDQERPAQAAEEFRLIGDKAPPGAMHAAATDYMTAMFAAGKGATAAPTLAIWASRHKAVPSLRLLHVDALIAAGDRLGAEHAARGVISDLPDWPPGYIALANLHRSGGRRNEADRVLKEVNDKFPDFAEAWVARAGVHGDAKDWGKAEAVLRDGLKATPEQPFLQIELATVLEISGRPGDALELYRALVNRFPNNLPILARAAVAMAGDPATLAEGRKHAEKANADFAGQPLAEDALGWVLIQANDVPRGLPLLESALKANAQDAGINYHAGVAYLRSGKAAEGRKLIEKAKTLGLRPDWKAAADKALAG